MDAGEQIVARARSGDSAAINQLFELAYAELRRLAHRRLLRYSDITGLNTTALVHECYLRLAHLEGMRSEDRSYLLAYCARAMRSIIIDLLRKRGAERHGGDMQGIELNDASEAAINQQQLDPQLDLLRVNEAIEELESIDARLARVVEMKYFAGLTFAQIAEVLGMTERTARRDWQKARLLLYASLQPGGAPQPDVRS